MEQDYKSFGYASSMKPMLENKYSEREIARMWNQLMFLSKGLAILGVLYATHTLSIFGVVVAVVACYTLYKINWR